MHHVAHKGSGRWHSTHARCPHPSASLQLALLHSVSNKVLNKYLYVCKNGIILTRQRLCVHTLRHGRQPRQHLGPLVLLRHRHRHGRAALLLLGLLHQHTRVVGVDLRASAVPPGVRSTRVSKRARTVGDAGHRLLEAAAAKQRAALAGPGSTGWRKASAAVLQGPDTTARAVRAAETR